MSASNIEPTLIATFHHFFLCSFFNATYDCPNWNPTRQPTTSTTIVSFNKNSNIWTTDTIFNCFFRHQIQTYTGKLAKDTSTHLHDLSNGVSALSPSEQRQWRLQRERLHNDFTKALNSFQAAQRTAAQKEKEVLKKAKAAAGVGGLQGPGQKNLIDIEEGQQSNQEDVQRKQQMLMQEEYDIEQLQERQRAINQLEVFTLQFRITV